MKYSKIFRILGLAALCAMGGLATATPALANATITIINLNGPGLGFNDSTPASEIPANIKGNNPGATLGEMRMNAFRLAADIWSAHLDSRVPMIMEAAFVALPPNVLGTAAPLRMFANFPSNGTYPGAEFGDTWYHVALANKRAGVDLAPGDPGTPADDDIIALFSLNFTFYLGLDNNHGTLNDLVTVLIHEFGHGLGFSNFVTEDTGSNAGPPFLTDIFSRYTVDETTGLHWDVMTDAERQASAINFRHVFWDGPNVTAAVPGVLAIGDPFVLVNSPAAIARQYQFGTAAFGPPLAAPAITGNLGYADDGVVGDAAIPGTIHDACEPLPAGSLTGLIGLADRGFCGFVVKAKIMQNAGAIATIIANIAPGTPPVMTGNDPTITIPSVSVNQADGDAIKANLPVNVSLGDDLSRRAGTTSAGFARLNTPNPVNPGSISHWDPLMSPNQLMEPAITPDLSHSVEPPEDMTFPAMQDIGWYADADVDGVTDSGDSCSASDISATVVIQSCDSHVPNTTSSNGCTISDGIASCVPTARNHEFVKCVTEQANSYRRSGLITNAQKKAIVSCAKGS